LEQVGEDVLKPLYEALVDPKTRHDLGEYYTPDWLATKVVGRLLDHWDWNDGVPRLLDPTCGSGTFLRAALEQLRPHVADLAPQEALDALIQAVVGIDVHPLAVAIARTTFALAI